jgi:retron-type reverse transcriptase
MPRIRLPHRYEDIISIENLLGAWEEFHRGKRKKQDVQEFERELMANVIGLHRELAAGSYRHGGYEAFKINDPKPRDIHKASVRDRLLHHALYRQLYPFFDRTFISDSYSCRLGKGTHKAMAKFKAYASKGSKNHTRTLWVLKCDIRKFFASIDHAVLARILERYIVDERICVLIDRVVESFSSTAPGKGLPLGNLTSQLLVNVYMNEFDQFAKHRLKARYYIRYADDFVFLSSKRAELLSLLPRIRAFLAGQLALELHPRKVSLATLASGIDFLGWVHFPDHRVLRTVAKRRMLRKLAENGSSARVASYHGMLSHGTTKKLAKQVEALATQYAPSTPD